MNPVTDDTFEELVLDAEHPVVVEFSAPAWCAPCRMLGKVLEDVVGDFPNLTFLEYNMDDGTRYSWRYLAGTLGSEGVPTVVLYDSGKPMEQFVGFRDRPELEQIFTRWSENYASED